MLTKTATVDGRTYVADIHPENRGQPTSEFVQVYRMRKDGTRGLQLSPNHVAALRVYLQVIDYN